MEHPSFGEIKQVGIPIKLSETPGELVSPPPLLGQHTYEILQDLGYNDEEIHELYEKGVTVGEAVKQHV
jgi:crotonobetainyl-CoA:carnitine CoA-transferase CaiB-like acyl-CoA transferase